MALKLQSFTLIYYNFLLYFFSSKLLVLTNQQGDSCVDQFNNQRGTCKFIFTCPYVIQLKISGGNYTKCEKAGGKEIVCCAERNSVPTATPEILKLSLRKYTQNCEKYKKATFDSDFSLTRLSSGHHIREKTSKCSQYTFPLVVGGVDAYPREFPHMALLGCKHDNGKYNWACGGSLISSNYILTAAHCFEASNCYKIDVVRLGDLNVEVDTDDSQPKDFKVAQILTHPQYNNSFKYNDIALVKLETEVEFNLYMRPACLPYQNFNNQTQFIITGWGSTQLAGRNAAHLQKAAVEQFEEAKCNDAFIADGDASLPAGLKYRTQLCAGSKQHSIDTCQGDSGGPLQTIHPSHPCMYSIIGITSYGQACGVIGYPGIYTRVYNYIDWIESIVWE